MSFHLNERLEEILQDLADCKAKIKELVFALRHPKDSLAEELEDDCAECDKPKEGSEWKSL